MKKKIMALLLVSALGVSVVACGDTTTDEPAKKDEVVEEVKDDKVTDDSTYESILEEYSKKLKEQAVILAEEYNNEAADLGGNLEELAELVNSKVEKLAFTSTEGMEKMALIMTKNGDEYEVYEEWALKLTDVYTEEAQTIMENYLNSGSEMDMDDLLNQVEGLQ